MARTPARAPKRRPKTATPAVLDDQPPELPGPVEFDDPRMWIEVRRAAIWLGMALLIVGVVVLAQPIMLIIGGLVFSVILDGGARLLGRVLPIGRGWRLAIVILVGFAFIGWTIYYAGTTFAEQAASLRVVIAEQAAKAMSWAVGLGLVSPEMTTSTITSQLMNSVGKLTSAISSVLGGATSVFLMLVIGIFIAIEPRLYDRSLAWMLPVKARTRWYQVTNRVGFTLRRLMAGRIVGMAFEGVFTFLMLWIGGVPMAALLGLLTGLLAFIPNIGAIVSGVLMVAVGFSAGTGEGLWALFVYFFVQNVDGYLVVPYIARRTVDLAPALVLATQLIFGALFGILGLLLADPIVAAIKVTLEELSDRRPRVDDVPPRPE